MVYSPYKLPLKVTLYLERSHVLSRIYLPVKKKKVVDIFALELNTIYQSLHKIMITLFKNDKRL